MMPGLQTVTALCQYSSWTHFILRNPAHIAQTQTPDCVFGEDQSDGGMRGDFISDVATIRLFYSLLGLKVMLLCCNSLSAGDKSSYFLRALFIFLCVCVCAEISFIFQCFVAEIKCC